MPPPWSQRVESLRSSAIREILRVVNRDDVVSLAGGLPGADLFPVERIAAIAGELFASAEGPRALQYAETEGLPVLRERIAARLPLADVQPDDILVTQGSQQAIDLLCKLFIDPGDEVLVETPAYIGALQAFRFFGARVTFLPCDGEGPDPGALAAALGRRPKLLYLTPTFQNPSGRCASAGRRQEIRAAIASSATLLVEDDPYRDIWYDDAPPSPVATGLDREDFVYLGSFSKTAVPGLRIGYLVGTPELVRRAVLAKQATDLQTNTLGQYLVAALIADPGFERHVERLRRAYRERRDALATAIAARLGDVLSFARPAGGMFLWGRLAGGLDAAQLLATSLKKGVAFVPGGEFHADGQGRDTLRLNFTHASPERLTLGAKRLGAAVEELLATR